MDKNKPIKRRKKAIDMESIGMRIKQKRTELGLTQTQIKESVGISSGNLSEFELGHRAPSLDAAFKLSKLFSCSIDWIVSGDSSKKENSHISQTEERYLKLFNSLSDCDQDEIIAFIELKLSRAKERKKSSPSNHSEGNNLTA